MFKNRRIIAAIIIFVGILTIPFLYNWGKSNKGPEINTGTIHQLATKQCIEPAEWMRANHMKLLDQWRNEYVREGKTVYVNSQGKSFKIGIDTCLNCHYNPALSPSDQFCVKCHDYASVKPTCWSCHPWPNGSTK
ncbi:putative sulfite reductase-associated electron transfer protein DsrJ [Desulfosporosinus acidiphilus SJ4]|uniref:Putative sulfite reductase-associated electron transfer protein DsrJ n=1 Tax=Desulfosporosinus acidiphilus (strain DSM 22704 / JCM 16185 / SJ4) TaxID=646529 RepID=I4DAE4_DESAJ|nr:sulfate reduction electron transfer complex DsrMKJOP subunit DsrJ [Desulfosporosinus acidiphilus]AFM42768.1 putative sulfite reductase-associated electron transfer protein DsrJ [Desulfosporosinus acidiphilus SJ4]